MANSFRTRRVSAIAVSNTGSETALRHSTSAGTDQQPEPSHHQASDTNGDGSNNGTSGDRDDDTKWRAGGSGGSGGSGGGSTSFAPIRGNGLADRIAKHVKPFILCVKKLRSFHSAETFVV
eukprot:COSAG05_NODE_2600_length_2856_cov_23.183418_2_plen_121_part_00